jgi:hypothetical protein
VPTFMDVHRMEGGVSATNVAKAHQADLATQEQYGVQYRRYRVDESEGRVFCLVDAPDAPRSPWPCPGRDLRSH